MYPGIAEQGARSSRKLMQQKMIRGQYTKIAMTSKCYIKSTRDVTALLR